MTRATRGGFFPEEDRPSRAQPPEREPTVGLGSPAQFRGRGAPPRVIGTAPEPPTGWRAHRGKLAFAAAALLALLVWALLPADLLRSVFFGEGYVRWREHRWQAMQQAERYEWPLVVYRTDPRHPADPDAFRARILAVPAVQDYASYLMWHHEVAPTAEGEEPRPPEVEIWHFDGPELLIETTPIAELTPETFLEAMREARRLMTGTDVPPAGGSGGLILPF